VTVIGGGGSGAAGVVETATFPLSKFVMTGGGAGGMAQSRLELDPSVTYTIIVGASADAVSRGPTTGSSDGNAGNASSFSGSGITTMTGNGGSAGSDSAVSTGDVTQNATGATGGTATGGNLLNVTGGASGGGSASTSTGVNIAATGGGGVGLRGVGYSGGDADSLSASTNSFAASGGGGVGGKGGDATESSASSTGTLSYGGGECGPAGDETNSGNIPTFSPESGLDIEPFSNVNNRIEGTENFIGNWLFGSYDKFNNSKHWARGIGGNANNGTSTNWAIFGGGGGAAQRNGNNVLGGSSQLGGGGGAAGCLNGTATSGQGGQGMVLIQIEEYLD